MSNAAEEPMDFNGNDTSQSDDTFLNSIIHNAFENKLLDSLYSILSEEDDCRELIKRRILEENYDANFKFHCAILIGEKALATVNAEGNLNSTHQYTFEINGECSPRPLCALQVAAMMGYEDLIELTIGNGSLPTMQAVDHSDHTCDKPIDISPLVLAARFGHRKFVKKVFSSGNEFLWNGLPIDATQPNPCGLTAVHFAAIYNHDSVIDVLLRTGAITSVDLSTGGYVKYPIAFAAALGNLQALGRLISAAACKDSKVVAVHMAAAMGRTDSLEDLLQNDDIFLAKEPDDKGHSPLFVALAARKIKAAELLVAKLTVKSNKSNGDEVDGGTSFDALISPNYVDTVSAIPDLNETLSSKVFSMSTQTLEADSDISEYESFENLLSNPSLLREVGRREERFELLSYALERDDPEKTVVILKAFRELLCDNPNKNSLIHLAAMGNKQSVLKHFVGRRSCKELITTLNDKNQLPLHLAIINDHTEAVECLLKFAPSATVKKMLGMTSSCSRSALHLAVHHHNRSNVKIIRLVVEAMKKHSVTFDQLDEQNLNALHYAVKRCRQQDLNPCLCIEQLSSLSPFIKRGGTIRSALHMAAESGDNVVLDLILRTFYVGKTDSPGKISNSVNDLDSKNRTALVICAENGNIEGMELLLTYEAEVGRVSENQDEVPLLHRLVKLRVEKPNEIETVLKVFAEIKKNAASTTQQSSNEDVMPRLLTEDYVKHNKFVGEGDGLNVLQLAAASGESELLSEFLKETNIVGNDRTTGKPLWKLHHIIPVELCSDGSSNSSSKQPEKTVNPKSCIELIVMNCETNKFRKMLDVEPLSLLIEQLTYGRLIVSTFMVIMHLIFMACLSVYAIQSCNDFLSAQPGQVIAVPYAFCLFLIYPIIKFILIIFEVSIYFRPSDLKELELLNFDDDRKCTYTAKYLLFESLSYVTSMVFCILIIVWYAQCISVAQNHVSFPFTTYAKTVSVVMVFGWLYTIELLRGIPTLQGFGKYLKMIFVKDVLRIVAVYGLVLTGFALAIHVCILVESNSAETVTDTFFETFGQMFGQADTFGAGGENRVFDRLSMGQQSGFVRGLMAIYMLMSAIILVNVLIAMINQSYDSVYEESKFLMNYETSKMFVDLTCKTNKTSVVWRWIFRKWIFSSISRIFVNTHSN